MVDASGAAGATSERSSPASWRRLAATGPVDSTSRPIAPWSAASSSSAVRVTGLVLPGATVTGSRPAGANTAPRRDDPDRHPHLVVARVAEHQDPVAGAAGHAEQQVAGRGRGLGRAASRRPTSPVPSSSTESATSTASRPRLVVTWAISSPRRGTTSARSIFTPSPPGTEMPSSSGTSSGPACDQRTTSPTARPAFGLTSSMTELWVAPEPRPVNHCSARRRPAVRRGERGGARAAGDQRPARARRRR